jgi:hypothetical protein
MLNPEIELDIVFGFVWIEEPSDIELSAKEGGRGGIIEADPSPEAA